MYAQCRAYVLPGRKLLFLALTDSAHRFTSDRGGREMASSHGMRSASQQQSGWPASQADPEIRRPSTLRATVLVSALGALCAFMSALITFVDGRSLLSSSLGLGSANAGSLASSALDGAYSTLKSRAIIALVAVVIVVALTIAARGGRTGVRVGLTIMLPVAAVMWVINVADSGVPGLLRGLDGVAVIFAVIALFLIWLPANNSYARERKALREGR
jgi:hypothetical protein